MRSTPTVAQLRAFVAVAEFQHFRDAASSLGVTQPTLSQSLAAMESRLGVRLIERNPRKVLVTPEGRFLLPLAKQAVDAVDAFRTAALPDTWLTRPAAPRRDPHRRALPAAVDAARRARGGAGPAAARPRGPDRPAARRAGSGQHRRRGHGDARQGSARPHRVRCTTRTSCSRSRPSIRGPAAERRVSRRSCATRNCSSSRRATACATRPSRSACSRASPMPATPMPAPLRCRRSCSWCPPAWA